MKSLQTLNTDIRTEMQLDPGLISDAERTRFINAGIEDLSLLQLWERETTIAVLANVTEINMPIEHISTSVAMWNNQILNQIQQVRPPGTVTGSPIGFIEKQGNPNRLELYPRSSVPGSLFLRFKYRGIPLVNPLDIPNFHIDVSELLINFAVASAHRKNGNLPLFNQYISYYEVKKIALNDRLLKDYNSQIRTIEPNYSILPLTPFDFL